jgi:hypothetical protein
MAEAEDDVASSTKKLNLLAGVLGIAAFGLPFAAVGIGIGNGFSIGEGLVYLLLTLVVAMVIVGLVTRRKSPRGKAIGRVVVGGALCAFTCFHLYAAQTEKAVERDLAVKVQVLQRDQVAKFAELGQRFNAVNVNGLLTPATLTTAAGQATARGTIAQYRALLAERRMLFQTATAQTSQLMAGIQPGETHDAALAAVVAGQADTSRVYADLDQTQTAQADSMIAILDWGKAQGSKLGAQNNQLLFSTSAQQAELQGLLAKLTASEAEVTRAVAGAREMQGRAAVKMRDANAAMQQLQQDAPSK